MQQSLQELYTLEHSERKGVHSVYRHRLGNKVHRLRSGCRVAHVYAELYGFGGEITALVGSKLHKYLIAASSKQLLSYIMSFLEQYLMLASMD